MVARTHYNFKISSDGYTFSFRRGRLTIYSEGTTHNVVASYMAGHINTEQDLQTEAAWWLYEHGGL